jgi:HlyD family secretion protein
MTPRIRLVVRSGVALLVLTGSVFAVREFRKTKQLADLPVATARKGEFLVLVRSRGQLMARRSEQLAAPLDVSDLQIVWQAPAGGEVKQGQPVIRFDPSRTQQDLKEKNSALNQAQSTLDQAVAQARITEDQDKLDLSTAKYTVEKAKLEASKQAIMSVIQGEESAIDLSLAEQKLRVQNAAMQTHHLVAESHVFALERARDTAKHLVELTQSHLALMELKSPLNGVINYMPNYSQGWMNAQPFKVGDHAAAGQVLAEIPDLSTLEMECKIEEVDRGRIAAGTTVLVHVDAFPEKVVSAKVSNITPLTEQSFNEWPPTRSFRAFAALENADPRMRPGMNAGADLVERRIPDAVSIPAKALFTIDGKPAVYVKANGQYVLTKVQVTAKNPDQVAVQGIEGGTQVALTEPPKGEGQDQAPAEKKK